MSAERQKTILLVEDEVVTAMAGKIVLEKYGNKVLTAHSGEEAVATVEKTPDIDLILMDINLGAGIDGAKAAEIILSARDLPVVFLSSHSEPEIVAKTEKIISYGYVVKHSCNSILDASIKIAFKLFEAKTREKEKESQKEAALKALRESEARYWMLFSGASDGILVADSKTGQFRNANPAICRMLGYTEEEFLCISVDDIHPKESLKHVLTEFESLVRGETESTPDLPCLRKDGTVFYATISHSSMVLEGHDYIAGFFHDVTERKQAEKALGESEVRFRELFNRMSSGGAVYEAVDDGEDFIIRNFNPAAEKIEKVSREDVLGKRVSEVFPGTKAFGVFKVFQKVWRTGKAEYYPENICKTEGDSGHWQESWRENWVFKLSSGEIVAIYKDISERKQAGEEIQRQLTEKEILLREVHHRIKNNIASIGGLISLQLQSVSNPEAIAVLQDTVGRVNSMGILYDKLLLTEGYKDVSVKNYVESLIASVVALFPDNAKVTIDQQITDFQLDQKRLSPLGIIINELLTNIMKHAFINRDGGLIKISLTHIDKHATLTIQDDGDGLPPGFEINESKGFGLMLVKMLSQQLGGSFSIEKHQGTRCRLEFVV